jgi:tetratricopeptide (TPR) repeat protein
VSRFLPIFLVFGVLAGRTASAADDRSATTSDVVFLSVREPDLVKDHKLVAPLLGRELIRQAFLIAARDECGLTTRDKTLREELPATDNPRSAPFEMYCDFERPQGTYKLHYVLSTAAAKENEKWWEWTTEVPRFELLPLLTQRAEALSRGDLKELIQRKGWGKPVPAIRRSAEVPREAEDSLWEWNELAVLGGLRRLHAEMREKGEAPELLATLAIGYANLGMLTEYWYSPAQKAFSARALLYAERLLHATESSPWALWHRAYVRAIVGMHLQAESDIAAAKKRTAKVPETRPLPSWTGVIEIYCEGKLPQMIKAAKTERERRLARYLNLEAAMWVLNNDLRVKAAQSVLDECHDSFSAWDDMCSMHSLGVLESVTSRAFDDLSKSLLRRLPEVPGLPKPLATRIREHKPSRRADEVEFRVRLVDDLKSASTSSRDKMEPSLDALGQAVVEIEFTQVMRRLELERYVFGVRADETIETYRPLCARHRYGAVIDLFSSVPLEVLKGVAVVVQKIDPAELTYTEAGPLRMGQNYNARRVGQWLDVIQLHTDRVLRDLILGIEYGAAGPANRYNGPYMDLLEHTSTKFPAAVAAQISRNWKTYKPRAPQLEKEFADDPIVMTALTNKYKELKQFDDAERCAKQQVQLAPDYPAYRSLAEIYKVKGDMTRWKATLEKSLELPSLGLEGFWVRNMIARHHMDRGEWKEALPYAEGAAASYAGWALETSARCHEMLGDWKKSESLMHAIAERYENSAFDWMVWCYRTGHGDREAATELARHHFESLGTAANATQLENIGVFYLLQKEPEKALPVFEKAYRVGHNAYAAMHASLVADSLGKTADRDQNLNQIIVTSLGGKSKTVGGVYSGWRN